MLAVLDAPLCSGIDKHTAALLAQQGATVLVHGRTRNRVQRTLRELRNHTASDQIFAYCYDLSSLKQTRDFAEHLRRDILHHFDGRWVGACMDACARARLLPPCPPGAPCMAGRIKFHAHHGMLRRLHTLINNAAVFNEERLLTEVGGCCAGWVRSCW